MIQSPDGRSELPAGLSEEGEGEGSCIQVHGSHGLCVEGQNGSGACAADRQDQPPHRQGGPYQVSFFSFSASSLFLILSLLYLYFISTSLSFSLTFVFFLYFLSLSLSSLFLFLFSLFLFSLKKLPCKHRSVLREEFRNEDKLYSPNPRRASRSGSAYEPSVFLCISMLARAVGGNIESEMSGMLDQMFSAGLTVELTSALQVLSERIPTLQREIQGVTLPPQFVDTHNVPLLREL